MDWNGANADKNKETNLRSKYEVVSTDLAHVKERKASRMVAQVSVWRNWINAGGISYEKQDCN